MRLRTTAILCAFLIVIGVSSFFDVYRYTRDTCLECRAIREKRWIYGIPIRWIAHNPYSRSVLASEPAHQHQWRWWGSKQSYSLGGITRACGRQHPIWDIPIEVQAEYAHLVPPPEFRDMLHTIDTADCKIAHEAIKRVYERVLDSR